MPFAIEDLALLVADTGLSRPMTQRFAALTRDALLDRYNRGRAAMALEQVLRVDPELVGRVTVRCILRDWFNAARVAEIAVETVDLAPESWARELEQRQVQYDGFSWHSPEEISRDAQRVASLSSVVETAFATELR